MTAQQRTQEQSVGIARRRIKLIIELAPNLECAECGRQVKDPAELVIDHVDGKAWEARKLSSSQRIARYRREHKAGIALRALCGLCNSTDGGYRRHGITWSHRAEEDDEVPF